MIYCLRIQTFKASLMWDCTSISKTKEPGKVSVLNEDDCCNDAISSFVVHTFSSSDILAQLNRSQKASQPHPISYVWPPEPEITWSVVRSNVEAHGQDLGTLGFLEKYELLPLPLQLPQKLLFDRSFLIEREWEIFISFYYLIFNQFDDAKHCICNIWSVIKMWIILQDIFAHLRCNHWGWEPVNYGLL